MALTLANRVRETTTTTGTGTVTLAGAVTGYQAFSVIGNANTTYYTISGQGTSEFEVGIGTYTLSGTTLSRDTVLASSNAGSLVNFSAGTKDAFVTYPSSKSVYLDASGNASALGTPASGTVTNLTGTASININGTVGATTPSTISATTGVFSGAVTGAVSQAVFNTVSTTVNAFGAATTLNIGAATGTLTVANTTLAAKAITASTTLGVTGATTLAALSATTGAFSGLLSANASLAVTGTLTATGTAAIGSTSFSNSKLYVTGTFGASAGITDAAIEVYVDDDGSTPKSGDRSGIKSVLYNVGRTTGKTVGLYTDVSEIDQGTCYGTYSKVAGTYGSQYSVYAENAKNLAAYTGGYCFYGKATTTSSGGQVFYLFGDDNGTTRIFAGQNGGLSNYQANDTNLSDRREKKDFAPAKSYLDVICAIPVQTFRYIDQKDDDLNLGVVAQDVQVVAPELVVESDWAAPDQESKVRLSVYQTDLQFALMKAIQELAAKVAKLEAA